MTHTRFLKYETLEVIPERHSVPMSCSFQFKGKSIVNSDSPFLFTDFPICKCPEPGGVDVSQGYKRLEILESSWVLQHHLPGLPRRSRALHRMGV